jgi:hypothetical protein
MMVSRCIFKLLRTGRSKVWHMPLGASTRFLFGYTFLSFRLLNQMFTIIYQTSWSVFWLEIFSWRLINLSSHSSLRTLHFYRWVLKPSLLLAIAIFYDRVIDDKFWGWRLYELSISMHHLLSKGRGSLSLPRKEDLVLHGHRMLALFVRVVTRLMMHGFLPWLLRTLVKAAKVRCPLQETSNLALLKLTSHEICTDWCGY